MKTEKTNTNDIASPRSEEIRINRLSMYAAWTGVVISLFAITIAIYSLWFSLESRKENYEIVYSRVTRDAEVDVTEAMDITTQKTTGVLEVFFEFYISNNGDNDISLILHDINEVDEWNNYSKIKDIGHQITYYLQVEEKYIPTGYPLVIEAGHSERIYIKVPLYIAPVPYLLIKENFGEQNSGEHSLDEIEEFLKSYNIDLYNNQILIDSESEQPYVAIDWEQVFRIIFETSRRTERSGIFSYYGYNDLYFFSPQ